MVGHPGRIHSRDQLLDLMHDDLRDVTDRVVGSHIRHLRRKLGGLVSGGHFIHSVYGAGYRFDVPESTLARRRDTRWTLRTSGRSMALRLHHRNRRYLPHVTNISTAAAAIVAVASQPKIFSGRGIVKLPMTRVCEPISIITTINGTATTPLMTALQ